MSDWWLAEPDPRLSQGDVICNLASAVIMFPMQTVGRSTEHGVPVWAQSKGEPDSDGMLNMIARGRLLPSLVLSHSCDLDKGKTKMRVIVTQMMPASNLPPKDYEIVFSNRNRAKIPLPNVPGLGGDYYADLRLMQPVDGRFIEDARRVASITEPAIRRLHKQLILFFARSDQ